MSTPELVVSIATELLVTDPLIPFALTEAAASLSPRVFGTRLPSAQAAWAAHFVTMQHRAEEASSSSSGSGAGTTATVKSKKDGDVSITWADVAGGSKDEIDAWLKMTSHGMYFLTIRNTRARARAGLTGV